MTKSTGIVRLDEEHWDVMLRARGVAKSYGQVCALAGVDLDVDAGQIVSLLGRNGAGKTTMLSIIAGLLIPDEGSVTVGGVDILGRPGGAAHDIGIAPQETGVYPTLTVRQNLEFFGQLSGMNSASRHRRSEEVAERLGLAELIDRRTQSLSGGETRRLHTACALVHSPKLLMLDEPTVGADVATRAQLIEAVRELADEGAAVVYTTHYLPEVEALRADVVIIDDGKTLASGTQRELIEEHELRGLRFELVGDLPVAVSRLEPLMVAPGTYQIVGEFSMANLLELFGKESDRLVSVQALKPDLEAVFLKVTGRRLAANSSDQSEEVA